MRGTHVVAAALLIGLLPNAGWAQGAPAPVWERKYGSWSVALLPGGIRCAMFGATSDGAHRVQIAANLPQRPAPAFVELIGSVDSEHVRLQPEQEIRMVADGRTYLLRVSSTFRAALIATFVTPFDPALARAAQVEIDTGHSARLSLNMSGLASAADAMADCLDGRTPGIVGP